MDTDYSKRELDMKFMELEKQIDENHTETLEKISESDRRNHDKQIEMLGFLSEIKLQMKALNHRTSKLEGWRMGIVMCITLFIVVIMPLLIYIFGTLSSQIKQNQFNIQQMQISSKKP